jgi:hypothetical protein
MKLGGLGLGFLPRLPECFGVRKLEPAHVVDKDFSSHFYLLLSFPSGIIIAHSPENVKRFFQKNQKKLTGVCRSGAGAVEVSEPLGHPLHAVAGDVPAIPREPVGLQLPPRAAVASHIPTGIPRKPELCSFVALKELGGDAFRRKAVEKRHDSGEVSIHL